MSACSTGSARAHSPAIPCAASYTTVSPPEASNFPAQLSNALAHAPASFLLSSTCCGGWDERTCGIHCQSTRRSPGTSSGKCGGRRAGNRSRTARSSGRSRQSDRTPGPHGEIDSDSSGRGGNETAKTLHAGDSRVALLNINESRRVVASQESPRVTVARVVRPHGRRGEVAAEILTDFPERLANLQSVELWDGRSAPWRAEVRRCW